MNTLKRIALLFLAVLMMTIGWMTQEGMAAQKNPLPSAPTEGIPSKDLKNGEGSTLSDVGIEATQYLMSGQSFISLVSSTQVTVSGNTKAYSSVDTIAVSLYLQRWDASQSQWVDITYVGEFKNNNAAIVSGSKNVNVVSGYYYRTRAYHWVSKGGTVEQANSYSSYIYAN